MRVQKKMYFKKNGLVNLIGGFGNQLYQIAFAEYLSDNGFDIKININWFKEHDFNDGTTKRNLEINVKDFGHSIAYEKTLAKYKYLEEISNKKLIERFYRSKVNFYYKAHIGNTFNVNENYINNFFEGYWQNSEYIVDKKEFILNGLNKNKVFQKEYSKNEALGHTLIHIRKGDYTKWGEDLSFKYFLDAVSRLKKEAQGFKYDIFTDEQTDLSHALFSKAENVFNDLSEKPIYTLARMTNYKNYIISNSSLSFFSAFLSKSFNPRVIYPEPWFKENNYMFKNLFGWESQLNK